MTRYSEGEELVWFKPARSKNKAVEKIVVRYESQLTDLRSVVVIKSSQEKTQVMTDHLVPFRYYMGRKSDLK